MTVMAIGNGDDVKVITTMMMMIRPPPLIKWGDSIPHPSINRQTMAKHQNVACRFACKLSQILRGQTPTLGRAHPQNTFPSVFRCFTPHSGLWPLHRSPLPEIYLDWRHCLLTL